MDSLSTHAAQAVSRIELLESTGKSHTELFNRTDKLVADLQSGHSVLETELARVALIADGYVRVQKDS